MKISADGHFVIERLLSEYEPEDTEQDAADAVTLLVRTPLTNNQFSALVSLVMSIGIDEFKCSYMLRLLNSERRRDRMRAAFKFHEYVYMDNGQLDPFLDEQRTLEQDLYLTPEITGGTDAL